MRRLRWNLARRDFKAWTFSSCTWLMKIKFFLKGRPKIWESRKSCKITGIFIFTLFVVFQGTVNCPKRLCILFDSSGLTWDSIRHVVVKFNGGLPLLNIIRSSLDFFQPKFRKKQTSKTFETLFKRCNSVINSVRDLCKSMPWAKTGWEVLKCSIWDVLSIFSFLQEFTKKWDFTEFLHYLDGRQI